MTDRFDALADRLADRVVAAMAELLEERDASPAPLLNATQAAGYLGVHRSRVYALARSGKLPAIRLGDSERAPWRFDHRALAEYLATAQPPGKNGRPDSAG